MRDLLLKFIGILKSDIYIRSVRKEVTKINIKNMIFLLFFGAGFTLGIYLLLITGSYFLLFFTSLFGLLFGYLFGNMARQSIELKRLNSRENREIKN